MSLTGLQIQASCLYMLTSPREKLPLVPLSLWVPTGSSMAMGCGSVWLRHREWWGFPWGRWGNPQVRCPAVHVLASQWSPEAGSRICIPLAPPNLIPGCCLPTAHHPPVMHKGLITLDWVGAKWVLGKLGTHWHALTFSLGRKNRPKRALWAVSCVT